ncbi:MAG: response regulator [Proteobacteria bacterium]|nr:response regulator [Pseudomonadota bacterium]
MLIFDDSIDPSACTVMVVDDVQENRNLLERALQGRYRVRKVPDGETALLAMEEDPPDLVLLDVRMPGMDGFELVQIMKVSPLLSEIPVIFITGLDDIGNKSRGFALGGVDYITKPFQILEVQARVKTHISLILAARKLKHHAELLEQTVEQRTQQLSLALEKLKGASLDSIYRLARAAEYRDDDTAAHVERMSRYSRLIALALGLNHNTAEAILYAAPMHDVGKIGIPDRILLKPGKLDSEEWTIMKSHSEIGKKILEGADGGFLKLAEVIAWTHHEKWDGSGYPRGLAGTKIPLVGRITAVTDVFDALICRRPYKEPFPVEKALRIIREGSGGHFDPRVVDAFFSVEDQILGVMEEYKES